MTTAEIARDTLELPHADASVEELAEGPLLDHSYDGIREYDNPLPGWWRSIFVGTIVFSGFYALYFHVVGWGQSPEDHYKAALAVYDSNRETRERAELANVNEDFLVQQTHDGKVLARGAAIFKERCASCHGPAGAGLIGPNLTDDHQLHGTARLDIYKTVRGGVPGTAMLAWGEQMGPLDVIAAASFAITLRNTHVAGKTPEGQPVQPFGP